MCNQPLPRTLWRGAISHVVDSRSVGSRNGCAVRPPCTTHLCVVHVEPNKNWCRCAFTTQPRVLLGTVKDGHIPHVLAAYSSSTPVSPKTGSCSQKCVCCNKKACVTFVGPPAPPSGHAGCGCRHFEPGGSGACVGVCVGVLVCVGGVLSLTTVGSSSSATMRRASTAAKCSITASSSCCTGRPR